jgi:hypothetical protein
LVDGDGAAAGNLKSNRGKSLEKGFTTINFDNKIPRCKLRSINRKSGARPKQRAQSLLHFTQLAAGNEPN